VIQITTHGLKYERLHEVYMQFVVVGWWVGGLVGWWVGGLVVKATQDGYTMDDPGFIKMLH